VRFRDQALYAELDRQLLLFGREKYPLPGVSSALERDVFIRQLIDSIRRVKYVYTICGRDVSSSRADPASDYFDPLKASVLFQRQGMIDEAFWLVFLAIHFGKNLKTGWRLTRDIYGRLGDPNHWTWSRTSSDPNDFKQWLSNSYSVLTGDGIPRYFGNHRKYETLKPNSNRSTGLVIESYINWVGHYGGHESLIQSVGSEVDYNPRGMFNYLYRSMNEVISFGRTARFDYLTMVAKMGLAPIEPGSTYMQGSTGPIKGARLLFGGNMGANVSRSALERRLIGLEEDLSLGEIGMQVIEDALCNWQKSPRAYKYFAG